MEQYSNYRLIHRETLLENAKTVADFVGVPVIGVLKCDGYGVGLYNAAAIWKEAGASMLAVSMPEEAISLREAGVQEDILLLAPVADTGILAEILEQNIILTVSDLENACFYRENRGERTVRAHIAVDTGMGRFGFRWTDTQGLEKVYGLEGFSFEGIFSHFAQSFEKEYKFTKMQLERFLSATDYLAEQGIQTGTRHIANSCAALRFADTRLDAVRIGSGLVGALGAPVPIKLKRDITFCAQVVAIKHLEKGDTTGYASLYKAKKPVKAAVVAIGSQCGLGMNPYPDTCRFRDLLSAIKLTAQQYFHPPVVEYQGKKLKLIGRIGSQYTLFDATGTQLQAGQQVTAKVSLLFPGQRRVME